jgi:NAD-dependent oxidoreductase involved in siderophore biosynthesis
MTFVLEAVDGRRPPAQLAGVVTDDVVRSMRVTAGVRTRLGGLHLCRAAPEAFELAGTLIQGSRVRALAARVEYHDGAWQCTVFRVLSG